MAKKESDALYFVTVDKYEDNPENGQLMLVTPVQRIGIPFINKSASTVDGVYQPAVARSLNPDQWHGIYVIPADAEYREQMLAVMKAVVKKYDGKIIGPFETREEAIQAKHAVRQQTPREQIAALKGKTEAQNVELEELKAKLAAIQKK